MIDSPQQVHLFSLCDMISSYTLQTTSYESFESQRII